MFLQDLLSINSGQDDEKCEDNNEILEIQEESSKTNKSMKSDGKFEEYKETYVSTPTFGKRKILSKSSAIAEHP